MKMISNMFHRWGIYFHFRRGRSVLLRTHKDRVNSRVYLHGCLHVYLHGDYQVNWARITAQCWLFWDLRPHHSTPSKTDLKMRGWRKTRWILGGNERKNLNSNENIGGNTRGYLHDLQKSIYFDAGFGKFRFAVSFFYINGVWFQLRTFEGLYSCLI